MSTAKFSLIAIAIGALFMAFAHWFQVDYLFFACYTILQFIVLATAWNILGGYCGYVNFGSAAFFAIGAYSSVALHKFDPQNLNHGFPNRLHAVAFSRSGSRCRFRFSLSSAASCPASSVSAWAI